MARDTSLIEAIDRLIERLSMPLSTDDLAAGWAEPWQCYV